MTDLHIEDFYKDVAMVFLRLYATFPRKMIVYVEDICGEDEPDEFGLHSDRFMSGFSTMIWLGEHDYLRYDTAIKQEALDQVVLSERGFVLLSSQSSYQIIDEANTSDEETPPSIQHQSRSNIIQLRNAVKSRSSIEIKHCVQYLLSTK